VPSWPFGRAKIFSQTDNKTVPASPDGTVLEVLHKADIDQIHACGGDARCTTCRIYIMEGLQNCRSRNEKEALLAKDMGCPENIRLACQTRIKGDIPIKHPVIDEFHEGRFHMPALCERIKFWGNYLSHKTIEPITSEVGFRFGCP